MVKRAIGVLSVLVVIFCGLTARIWVLSGTATYTVTSTQSSKTRTLAVARGTIYDRYGQPLVNQTTDTVALLSSSSASVDTLFSVFSDEEAREAAERLSRGERLIVTLPNENPLLTSVSAPVRYGDNACAVHLIGYVDGEGNGVCGLEMAYDSLLRIDDAKATVSYTVDALGRAGIHSTDVVQDLLYLSSSGIVTTLDSQIQQIVSQASQLCIERGAVLVSEVHTGDILAALSMPLYDPRNVAKSLERADAPLIDRTMLNYNLGSVFKIITAAAALESGIHETKQYICDGTVTVNGVSFGCHNEKGDGTLNMREAMARSCNCYFIQLALEVGGEAMAKMAEKAHFGETIVVADGLQTASSLIPQKEDLSVGAAVANFSIGQGDLLASPIHVQALLAAVANDGVWNRPNVFLGTVDENGEMTVAKRTGSERLFSMATAKTLKEMLTQVVETGTGQRAAGSYGRAAGKTGTAQTGWVVDGQEVVQSWFSGFYPAEDPQYVITVLSENGGATGKTAAPLFSEICNRLYEAGLVEKEINAY